MREKIDFKTEDILNVLDDLEILVVALDKIGSGFEDTDACSSAIHLFLLEKDVLNKLSVIRKKLSENFLEPEFDEYYEREIDYYVPDYKKTKKELIASINEILGRKS